MIDAWTGNLTLPTGRILNDIIFSSHDASPLPARFQSLRFLSTVEVSRIPLYLSTGYKYDVATTSPETEEWFSSLLVDVAQYDSQNKGNAWWNAVVGQSPIGILAEVEYGGTIPQSPKVTEVLFYCERSDAITRPPSPPSSSTATATTAPVESPQLLIKALLLSSDFLYSAELSPATDSRSLIASTNPPEAQFLSSTPPSSKRKSVDTVFDLATTTRHKARLKPGESIAAAASRHDPSPPITLPHKRSVSHDSKPKSPTAQAHTTDLIRTRSPSLVGSDAAAARPGSRSGVQHGKSTSGLREVMSFEGGSTEESNRDVVARVVMGGMRMYGMEMRRRKRGVGRDSTGTGASMGGSVSAKETEQEAKDAAADEEYKLVYHQVFKGTVFAFRKSIPTTSLSQHVPAVRDIVDKLLAIFCTDQFAARSSVPEMGLRGNADVQQDEDPFVLLGGSQRSTGSGVNVLGARRAAREREREPG